MRTDSTLKPRIRALAAFTAAAAAMTALTIASGSVRASAMNPSPERELRAEEEGAGPVIDRELELVTEAVPFETVEVWDPERYSDEVELLRPGVPGLQRVGRVTVYEGGFETGTYSTAAATVVEPVDEIVSRGALPGSRTDSRGYYVWPACGVISSGYGSRSVSVGSSNHKGLDIANSVGTDVRAADGGTVIYAGNWEGSGYGNIVKLRHDNGDVTYYAHLSEILVSPGDLVAQGELIAKMGATGNVSGPHLHFELRPGGGEPVDPASWLTGELERG